MQHRSALKAAETDNRLFVNGVLWVLRSGVFWQHLPEGYGKWKSVHARFTRWAKAGVGEKVFAELIKDRDNKYLMLDTTLVRVHQQAAAGKGGTKLRRWGVPEAMMPSASSRSALEGTTALASAILNTSLR